jgi:hypothetical protein
VANLPLVSTTPAANFATSVNNDGGKIATGISSTDGKQWEQYQIAYTLK